MKLIVCLDDRNGMTFGGRRQSRDAVVIEKIIAMATNGKLWMNGYSAKIFAEFSDKIQIDDAFLDNADTDDFCFVENLNVAQYSNQFNQIIVFKWNRHYPADRYLDIDLNTWKMDDSKEFSGNSHDKITMEIYVNEG